MKHTDAMRLLDDYLAGSLDADDSAELRTHLDGCAECGGWVEDHRLFAEALTTAAEHPSSDQLARQAVDPELLEPPERSRMDEHLRACRDCRRELELTAAALSGARKSPRPRRIFGGEAARPAGLPVRLALAASLVLAVVLGFVLWPSANGANGHQDLVLTADDLSGSRVLEAAGSITASSVIETGNEVVLRAGQTVVLENGFAVASGASLVVEVGAPALDEASSDGA